jgi:hypothetical protein
MVGRLMNNESERIWKAAAMTFLKYPVRRTEGNHINHVRFEVFTA